VGRIHVRHAGHQRRACRLPVFRTPADAVAASQDGAFYAAAFSPDSHHLRVSGGNTDLLFVYAWKDGSLTLENKFELAKAKTTDGTGTSYPAGLAVSPNGEFVYVAENVGDRLAVVNAATGEITQRFSTDHYPYGIALTAGGHVSVSAWGGSTLSQFRVLGDGTLTYLGRTDWESVFHDAAPRQILSENPLPLNTVSRRACARVRRHMSPPVKSKEFLYRCRQSLASYLIFCP
jgi:hypothetical protein